MSTAVHLSIQARHYERLDEDHQQGEVIYTFYADGSFIGRTTLDTGLKRMLLGRLHAVTERASIEGWTADHQTELERLGRRLFQLVVPSEARAMMLGLSADRGLNLDVQDHDLPWELLHDGSDYLARRIPFARTLIRPARQSLLGRRDNLQMVVVGDPTNDLEGARAEAEGVARRCRAAFDVLEEGLGVTSNVRLLCGEEATKETVLLDLLMEPEQPIELLHYAGHARFDPKRPDHSGLVLSDGDLQGFEARTLVSCPLIFANGCRAAGQSGPGETLTHGAVSGLAGEFIAGGALGYIAPLWPIRDSVASLVAEIFYDAMIGGATISDALLEAKQQVQDTDALAYVFFGGFEERLSVFAPKLTGGPHVNDLGVRRIIEIEREYGDLEVLAVNDLPWILWDEEDIAVWVSRLPIDASRKRSVATMLHEYGPEFRNAVLAGNRRFLCILNCATTRPYLKLRGSDRMRSLAELLDQFWDLPNFGLILADTGDHLIEEIEFVSKSSQLPLRVDESIYVFNKQTGPEQSSLTYNLFEEHNTRLVAEYWMRFSALFDRAILAYGLGRDPTYSADTMRAINEGTRDRLARLARTVIP
ncbi:MAG TPA: CHAT domain-containing protein [Solirubrobacteraceae bacterium]